MPGLAHNLRHPAPDAEPRLPVPAVRTRADLAWEFLRRNPDYCRAFHAATRREASRGRWTADDANWGLEFPADPHAAAGVAAVFWGADSAPAVVIEAAPCSAGCAGQFNLGGGAWPQRRDGAVLHLRMIEGLQVRVLAGDLQRPLAAVAPLDDAFAVRLRTLARLNRTLRGQVLGPDFTAQQLRRLRQALQALDGRGQGMSHRNLAAELFGRAAVAREPWKSSTVRDTTQRLVRLGEHLRSGGYRKLLLTRPR